ncbi:MAG: ABC transporter permease [Xanthomonadales bacterium]|nr:ABC transporter permease [Xanthomonadales bacterium]
MRARLELACTALRQALRALRRAPGFTATALVALVLGLAAAGSMFAIVYGVLLAPLPYGDSERLVDVGLQSADGQRIQQPPAAYLTYRALADRLDGIGFHRSGNAIIGDEGESVERVAATWVTASTLPLLRVNPLLGRSFNADEERRDGPQAVILSESEWRIRFHAAPDVIGRTLVVNSVPRVIVGVMPEGFAFPLAGARIWLPVRTHGDALVGEFLFSAVARLAPGVSVAEAEAQLAAVLPQMGVSAPRLASCASTASWFAEVRPRPVVTPLREHITGRFASTLRLVAAAAVLVLLVAWANVANLVLIRAEDRAAEFGLRAALGAGRFRSVAHMLSESLWLGLLAGAIALVLIAIALRLFATLGPQALPRMAEIGLGWATFGFVALAALTGALLCAAVAVLRIRSAQAALDLRGGSRMASGGRGRQRLRDIVAALQIALAFAVAVGALLLARTAYRLDAVEPGFEAEGVILVRTGLPMARYDDASATAFYARLGERTAQLPSVRAAGVVATAPLEGRDTMKLSLDRGVGGQSLALPVNVADAGYFRAMRIPLLAGRGFRSADLEDGRNVLVSQRAAAMLFGEGDIGRIVGKTLAVTSSDLRYTVVGVVGDVHAHSLALPPTAMLYRPNRAPSEPLREPGARGGMVLAVRTEVAADAVLPAIRKILRNIDPGIPIFSVEPMRNVLGRSQAQWSLALALTVAAAAVASVLGMIGLYGVMAYWVALRRREFGIRVALGASASAIARAVVVRGLLLGVLGVGAGCFLYALGAPLLHALLYGVTAYDPATLAAAALLVVGMAMTASSLPARRAAKLDPAEALRAD